MQDSTKVWFIEGHLQYMFQHEWMFDSDAVVGVYLLLKIIVQTYSCVLHKVHDIITLWQDTA